MDDVIMTFTVAGVVIKRDDTYLLVQEKKQKVNGLWNLPSGKVENGFTIEETAIKEAKEETGYDVKLLYLIDIFHSDAESPVGHAYAAEIIGGNLNYPQDEIMDARWFTIIEIESMKDKLRNISWILDSIKSYK